MTDPPMRAEPGIVAVVGAGLVGQAWSVVFARAGHAVHLYDVDPAAAWHALGAIREMVDSLASARLLAGEEPAVVMARVTPVGDLPDALSGAIHVQECVPERIELKARITHRLAELAGDDAALASSTSGLAPSLFTADVRDRGRCLVAHPINPVHLHKAVELVPAPWTRPDVMVRTRDLLVAAGMQPVVLTAEIDGFVVNRLQGAILHEAFRLVAAGVVRADDVDRAVRDALAPRWSLMGLFETIDLNAPGGIRDYVERYERMYQDIARTQHDTVSWLAALDTGLERDRRAALPIGQLDDRREWRNQKLLDIAADHGVTGR